MRALLRSSRGCGLALVVLLCWVVNLTTSAAHGQTGNPAAATSGTSNSQRDATPLPDIPALMHSVEAQQRAVEQRQQDYIYRSVVTAVEVDGKGQTRKTETREYNVFWLQGVPVNKLIAKNGKLLEAGELAKEDGRIDKEVLQARERRAKNDARGRQTDPRGDEQVSVSRILELGTFGNARRVLSGGRATIAVDYRGDPTAKTRNRAESVFRDLTGTVWVDEADHEVVALDGAFARSFKIAGGLLADIHEGTRFSLTQNKVNDQAWMPIEAEASGSARLLIFSVHGSMHVVNSDFRRFRATATILPAINKVEEAPKP